jgi:hypothetical protein
VNLDEDFLVKMDYPTDNPDSLFYGGALLYDLDIVQTMIFHFTSVRYKIQNYFSELDINKPPTIF